jgi:hypothetical protein
MDAITEMFLENARRMGTLDAAVEVPTEPAHRTVEQSPVPVVPVVPVPDSVENMSDPWTGAASMLEPVQTPEFRIQSLEKTEANLAERLFKIEHGAPVTPTVPLDKIAELEQRVAALELLLKPALASNGKLDRIRIQYASIAGRTNLSFDQFRCTPKARREELLAGVGQ